MDLVFIQGQQSHALETWSLSSKKKLKLWPVEILRPAIDEMLEERKAGAGSIFMVRHDSYQLKRTHDFLNAPDNTIAELCLSISHDLRLAQIGQKRPFFIICFSMGGVIAREIVLNNLTKDQRENLKGVIFISSPLGGTSLKEQVQKDRGWEMSLMNNFVAPVQDSIPPDEFQVHFFKTAFETSRTSVDVLEAKGYLEMNHKFLDLALPYLVVQETEKALLPAAGRAYYIVEPAQTLLGK